MSIHGSRYAIGRGAKHNPRIANIFGNARVVKLSGASGRMRAIAHPAARFHAQWLLW